MCLRRGGSQATTTGWELMLGGVGCVGQRVVLRGLAANETYIVCVTMLNANGDMVCAPMNPYNR